MSTSEMPIEPAVAKNLAGAASEGAQLVGIGLHAQPAAIAEAINKFLEPKSPRGPDQARPASNVDNWTDRALPVGGLWGELMVRSLGWQWASLIQHDHDDFRVIAVVSPDRSLAIFPFHYCFGCLENGVYPAVLLAFNMLQAGKIPPQPAGGYVNLMDGVRHIIPPA